MDRDGSSTGRIFHQHLLTAKVLEVQLHIKKIRIQFGSLTMSVRKCWILPATTLAVAVCLSVVDKAWAGDKASYHGEQVSAAQENHAGRNAGSFGGGPARWRPARSVGPAALTYNTPFGEAIDILRNSTRPPLNIVVLWRDLYDNADVEPSTPIYMDGVSGVRLRTALDLVLRAVSSPGAELGYIVEGGVITIATRDSLPTKRVTRVYDISDLVHPPANYRAWLPGVPFMPGAMGLGGMGLGGMWPGQGLGAIPQGTPFGGAYGGAGLYGRGPLSPTGWPSSGYGRRVTGSRAGDIVGVIRDTVRP
jgi:hypothetical protein